MTYFDGEKRFGSFCETTRFFWSTCIVFLSRIGINGQLEPLGLFIFWVTLQAFAQLTGKINEQIKLEEATSLDLLSSWLVHSFGHV